MMRFPLTCLASFLTLTAMPVWAENRGVVVTNSAYSHAEAVENADAGPVADAMRAAGLRTVSGSDLKTPDLRKAVSDLLRPDDQPGLRLVLLTGHFLHDSQDNWLMAVDAENPDAFTLALGGVSINAIMQQMADAQPGAVLVLGLDQKGMPHGAGVEQGLGQLNPPEGVTVLTGPAGQAVAAAAALLMPGASVDQALQANPELTLVQGGDPDLVLLAPSRTPQGDERDLWAQAAADDTAQSYQSYLDRFPQGAYAAAARSRQAELGAASDDRDAWADAAARHSTAAYDDYLRRFPAGRFADAARSRLQELAPAAAPAKPAPVPAQPVASTAEQDEARLRLSRGDRQQIQRNLNALNYGTGGVDGVLGGRSRQAIGHWQRANGYPATNYLTSNQVQELRRQAGSRQQTNVSVDRNYWDETGARGGERNLRAYLDRYPNGIYSDRARAELRRNDNRNGQSPSDRDARAYDQARRQHTVQGYDTYLRNWPKGEYTQQARAEREALRRGFGGGNRDNILDLDPEKIIRELLK